MNGWMGRRVPAARQLQRAAEFAHVQVGVAQGGAQASSVNQSHEPGEVAGAKCVVDIGGVVLCLDSRSCIGALTMNSLRVL